MGFSIKRMSIAIALAFLMIFASFASAGQYNTGVETNDVSKLPDGFTVRMYNSFYTSDTFRDNDGRDLGFYKQNFYNTMLRAFYVTNWELLGGKYAFGVGLPFGYNNVKLTGIEYDNFNLGDVYVEPFILKWNQPRFDAFVSLGLFTPTGYFSADDPASIGHDYWTGMVSLGGTFYFDQAKTWSAFSTVRYEMSTESINTDYRPGDVLHGEYGVEKAFPICNDRLSVGVNGYTRYQLTDADNIGAADDLHQFVTAVGPAIGYHFDAWNTDIGAKSYFELGAKNQSEGYKFLLMLSKSF